MAWLNYILGILVLIITGLAIWWAIPKEEDLKQTEVISTETKDAIINILENEDIFLTLEESTDRGKFLYYKYFMNDNENENLTIWLFQNEKELKKTINVPQGSKTINDVAFVENYTYVYKNAKISYTNDDIVSGIGDGTYSSILKNLFTLIYEPSIELIKTDTKDEVIEMLKKGNINLTLIPEYVEDEKNTGLKYIINGDKTELLGIELYQSEKEVETEIEKRIKIKNMADGNFPFLYSYKNVIISYNNDADVVSGERPDTYNDVLEKYFIFRR